MIAISSTRDDTPCVCTFFIRPFFAAVADLSNDSDHDGRVSEFEAYQAARNQSFLSHYDLPYFRGFTAFEQKPERMSASYYLEHAP